jgi:hypothetical protein
LLDEEKRKREAAESVSKNRLKELEGLREVAWLLVLIDFWFLGCEE